MSFRSFIMSESIEPVKTDYGTDYQNKKWIVADNVMLTFYKTKTNACCVIIDNGNIGFMTAENIPTPEELANTDIGELFSFDKRKRSNALKTFNYFFYIILEATHKFNLPVLYFNPADKELGDVYDRIVKNPFFRQKLKDAGFEYIGMKNNNYLIKRF